MSTKKTVTKQGFRTGESVVYPSHGVGKITSIEEQEIAGHKLELFVINFPKEKDDLARTHRQGGVGWNAQAVRA